MRSVVERSDMAHVIVQRHKTAVQLTNPDIIPNNGSTKTGSMLELVLCISPFHHPETPDVMFLDFFSKKAHERGLLTPEYQLV